ncbi:MAG: YhdP family protein [Polaromonas sp.]
MRLPHVLGALSASSLWSLGFEQLLIDQPELDIRRAADGELFIGGLKVSKDRASGQSELTDWFFSQTEFVLRGGTVRWTDEMRQVPPLVLSQVNGVMRNARHRHLMRLDATPPAEWGERFSLRGIFRRSLLSVHAGDFSGWTGQLYADFSRVDVSRVKQYAGFDALGVELNRGHGALRAWADVNRGKFAGGVADLALREVDARLGVRLRPLAFESIIGRLAGRQRSDGFDVSTEGLQFRTQDGLQWPGGNVVLMHASAGAAKPQYNTLKADKLDLAALAQIASRLPLADDAQSLIASFAPRGLVETIDARWQGPMEAPVSFAARGRVAGLSLAALPAAAPASAATPAAPGRPGLSGATIDFDLGQDGGKASVVIAKGALDLPGIFEEARLPLDQLSADAQWKLTGQKIELQLRNLQFANADAQGTAQLRWNTSELAAGQPNHGSPDQRFPGVLDLQGSLSRGDGSRVHRYLPLVLDQDARHYVRDAVLQGQVSDVKFKVKGPLDHLPFADPAQGDFRVSARVRNGQLAYVPKALQPPGAAAWPALTGLNGELVFNRAGLEVNGATASVAGLPGLQLLKGDARIADLAHNATVDVNLAIRGALSDALAFVNSSPVGEMMDSALAKASATGQGDYRFRLTLPIHAIEKSRVEGTVTLGGNEVKFSPEAPTLEALKGVINVTERGFSVAGAQARLLGGEVRIDGASRPPASAEGKASVAFKAQGSISAQALRQARDLGVVTRLAQHASGSAPYQASVLFRRGIPEVTVTSSLQGMALTLPAPLAKAAETALPLRFENTLLPGSMAAGQKLQDQLTVSIGRVATISYLRDLSADNARVIRGSIGMGLDSNEAVPTPDSGVGANIKLAEVDLDAWEKILTEETGSAAQQTALTATPSTAMGYLPTVMAIQARQLRVQGRSLNHVVVGGTRDGLNWRANIDAAELSGYVEYRQPGDSGAGRVFARLSRLSLAASSASEVEAILDEQPASIPALDIVVDDMELRGRKLGRVEIDAVNRGRAAEGGIREWHLNKFNVTVPEATLTATGDWVAVNAQGAPVVGPRVARAGAEQRRSVMSFRLDIADSGELLKRFGMDGVLRRGKGRMEGQVAWTGSPLSLDIPTLSGQFNVNVEAGQFIKADPGIAKLLGVLSLQSLPRRLTLDFRDVFSQGFSFDFVRGDVSIKQGLARTNNLQMSGVNAAVLMEGSADISRETQNLKVVVVPEINAGTASLIATVINPAIGLGSFLAQMFLRRPLMEAATQEFHIDGSWSDPKITKIDRRAQAAGKPADPMTEKQ